MLKEYKSFGEYFDAQRIRIEKAMQNKNTQLHKEWREDFDKRQRVRDLVRLREEDEEEINTDSLQNEEDWENEGGGNGIYNSAQMLNGSFEGDTISQIGKKHQKKEKVAENPKEKSISDN